MQAVEQIYYRAKNLESMSTEKWKNLKEKERWKKLEAKTRERWEETEEVIHKGNERELENSIQLEHHHLALLLLLFPLFDFPYF